MHVRRRQVSQTIYLDQEAIAGSTDNAVNDTFEAGPLGALIAGFGTYVYQLITTCGVALEDLTFRKFLVRRSLSRLGSLASPHRLGNRSCSRFCL